MNETPLLHDALRFAGFLLAKQASTADGGEIPSPLAVLSPSPGAPPIFLKPTIDSQSLARRVAVGKIVLADQKSRFCTWALSFDEELEPYRILMLEVGCEGIEDFFLVQRYVHPEKGRFQLIGQIDLLTLETLDPTVVSALEACAWRELMEEGAEMDAEFGTQWRQWRAAMRSIDQDQRYTVGGHGFICPSGWVPGKARDGNGWMFYRLVPWDHKEDEPAIICGQAAWGGLLTVQEVVDHLTSLNSEGGDEILESGVFELEPGLLVGRVLMQLAEGNLLEHTIISINKNGQFLMVSAVSKNEFWAETMRARDVVLGSFDWREGKPVRKGFGTAIKNLMHRFMAKKVN